MRAWTLFHGDRMLRRIRHRSYFTKVDLRIFTLSQQVRAIHTNMAPIKTPLELNAKSWSEA